MPKSTLQPGEVLTNRDVHDLCRVRVRPITANDPWGVFDILARDGAWNMKYMIMAIHKGECPRCRGKCSLLEIQFLGHYFATGKVIPAGKRTKPKELWECQMYNLKRVESAFKYLVGERMDHLLEYVKDSEGFLTRKQVKNP